MPRLNELFQLYYNRNASEEQTAELMQLIQTASPDQLNGLILEHGEKLDLASYQTLSTDKAEAILQHILGKTVGKGDETGTHTVDLQSTDSPPRVYRIHFRRIAVAASLLIAIATGAYFLFFNKSSTPDEIVKTMQTAKDVEAPKVTRAMITLGDGRQISIDSLNTFTQGNVQLTKMADGKILYKGPSTGTGSTEIIYNTLSNPRGSKVIDMTLADGSHVWLNAGSSLTYPVAFVGNERKVEITGEAYFEVEHNSAMPFVLSKGNVDVTVLGTHFNVNAYDDEADIKVTLLEGSVKITKGSLTRLLKPNQQARVTEEIKIASGVDIREIMAWKDGYFTYNSADIQTLMRQAARWYDVEVVYAGRIPDDTFTGSMPRKVSLANWLKVLEKSGVQFRIDGKKVIVLP